MARAFPGQLDADLRRYGLTLAEVQDPGFPVETWLVLVETIAGDIGTITGAVLAGFTRPISPSELALLVIAKAVAGDALDFLSPLPEEPDPAVSAPRVSDLERRQAQRELEASFIFPEQ